MKAACKIYNIGLGKIKIVDTSEGFMVESGDSSLFPNQYKRSECKIITIVKYYTVDLENSELGDIIAYDINDSEIEVDIAKDGYYKIIHLIIPTDANPNKETFYFKDDILVKNINGTEVLCTEEDILVLSEINMINEAQCVKDIFYTKYLQQCYINVCKRLFKTKINKCDKEHLNTFDRDFLWMTINVLKYYSELGQLSEAQRLLQELQGCYLNSICTSSNTTTKSSSTCNCNE